MFPLIYNKQKYIGEIEHLVRERNRVPEHHNKLHTVPFLALNAISEPIVAGHPE